MSRHTHLYQNNAWKAIRKEQLQKQPLCEFCLARGRITSATVCDHIEPHRGDLERFWSGPFQSLCGPCHSTDKQRIENGSDAKPFIGVDGWPT